MPQLIQGNWNLTIFLYVIFYPNKQVACTWPAFRVNADWLVFTLTKFPISQLSRFLYHCTLAKHDHCGCI